MPITLAQYGIDHLPPEERLELVGLLWDSLNDEKLPPIPRWHQDEVERRIVQADARPGVGIPLEEAVDKMLGKP
ncbi:MAG: addiction module protein [Planctomycetia bacterium]|nr:addiction module protein [Planctomycetia bacterium]